MQSKIREGVERFCESCAYKIYAGDHVILPSFAYYHISNKVLLLRHLIDISLDQEPSGKRFREKTRTHLVLVIAQQL